MEEGSVVRMKFDHMTEFFFDYLRGNRSQKLTEMGVFLFYYNVVTKDAVFHLNGMDKRQALEIYLEEEFEKYKQI